jgi:hypothetical protein
MDYGTEDYKILAELKELCKKYGFNPEDTEQVIGWVFDKKGRCTAEDDKKPEPDETDKCRFNEDRTYCFTHKCGKDKTCGKEAGCPHHYTFGVIADSMYS